MTVYLVAGRLPYREHRPGATFEADLDPSAEARAVRRGDIQVIDPTHTTIQPGTWRLPSGWQHDHDKEG